MDTNEIKAALDEHGKAVETAMAKYDAQFKEKGEVEDQIKNEVRTLSERFEATITEIAQKMDSAKGSAPVIETAGQEFVKSEQFKALVAGQTQRARIDVKNTVSSVDGNTTFPQQNQAIIQGIFKPLTIRQLFRAIPVTTNMVNSLREASWSNNAVEVSQGAGKSESALTFEAYDVPITTVAHFIKVTNQLLADAPAIVAYINTRLSDGLAQRIDMQLVKGNGASPSLSGLTKATNFTAYTPTSGDNLVDAINRAKYALWADGLVPDTAIVNPADWGNMERMRENASSGQYLYGAPGMAAGVNPFGVRIVLSNNVDAGKFIVGALDASTVLYNRQGATVEMGYVDKDFTNNLVTIRAEERLGLGVERPAGIRYGSFSA